MARLDRRGLPLSTASDVAAERYREGVDLLLSAWPGAAEALDEAAAADPDFALAHAARARLHAIRAEPAQARARIAAAAEAAARSGTDRERSHVEVLSLVIHGQPARALERALAHADAWPRDVLVLSLPLGAFGLFAFSGMADHDQARVDLCERHARHFGEDDWWFLTYRGWAHAENGAAGLGRDLAQRAFDLRRANANAVHALSHAMFEGGAGEDADRLIAGWLPGYDRGGTLHGHIAWHAALVALERGDAGRALAIYADHVQPSASAGMAVNVMSDAASLLWRLRSYGHTVPEGLWEAAAAYAAPVFPQAGFAFADVHMALLAAATGDKAGVEQRATALTRLVEAGSLAAGPVVPAICRAALAFVEGDYAVCAGILEPVAGEVTRIGGSGAQREVIEDTLILALMRSGEAAEAHALLNRRLHRRPSLRDTRWLSQITP
ncbi:tetratricopeptide repeat protein [Pseudoroseomonas wenyumeiae]|uniref:Tetratricopeptide repeat protein n=1 Tax=Teichococcus wenyumeiae TaxID=2478470 RepID=A0A3A9JGC8_9PROT|nr:tetratricopeptide repeat protein [Pseudoroseomonas wenyumeiae]RKK04401.1 tetratricopeptide repeat protein [Pseudoroseomonas wenyumeiae]RMI19321.1 tetratricopeptide repeat protein [Pseudoroseomonas wenyumeiae]